LAARETGVTLAPKVGTVLDAFLSGRGGLIVLFFAFLLWGGVDEEEEESEALGLFFNPLVGNLGDLSSFCPLAKKLFALPNWIAFASTPWLIFKG
jgi:hypothetical protein